MIKVALYVLNCCGDGGTSSIRISYLLGPMRFIIYPWNTFQRRCSQPKHKRWNRLSNLVYLDVKRCAAILSTGTTNTMGLFVTSGDDNGCILLAYWFSRPGFQGLLSWQQSHEKMPWENVLHSCCCLMASPWGGRWSRFRLSRGKKQSSSLQKLCCGRWEEGALHNHSTVLKVHYMNSELTASAPDYSNLFWITLKVLLLHHSLYVRNVIPFPTYAGGFTGDTVFYYVSKVVSLLLCVNE